MKITLGNKQYIVSWQYIREDGLTPTTLCTISEILPDNTLAQVAQGSVGCYFKDNFNKNVGRKLSLERAMKQQVPNDTKGQWEQLFAKEQRLAVWKEYFKMRGDKW